MLAAYFEIDISGNNTTKALYHVMKKVGLYMKIYTYIIPTFYPKRYIEMFELRVFSMLKRKVW